MTAAASLTHVWVMVDHKLPTQLKRSSKLKTSLDFSISVFYQVILHLLSKNILSKHFVHNFYSVTTI